jgi:hypothetical protein
MGPLGDLDRDVPDRAQAKHSRCDALNFLNFQTEPQAPEGDYLLLPAVNDPLCGPTALLLISDGQFASGGPPGSTMALDPAA